MDTREWTTVDKSKWGRGPWNDEPDKRQWQDEATGLPCLMVRNSGGGNWCGYVGVPATHPWHGVSYSSCPLRGAREGEDERVTRTLADRRVCSEDGYCNHTPESRVEVHGGLTFSDACTPHTPESWERFRGRMKASEAEARQYPVGDAARRLGDPATRAALESYEAYVAFAQSRYICHLPEPGEPDNVWWFGFDCAHSGDMSPGYDRDSILGRGYDGLNQYRDAEYVAAQCRRLARQLHALASEGVAPEAHV